MSLRCRWSPATSVHFVFAGEVFVDYSLLLLFVRYGAYASLNLCRDSRLTLDINGIVLGSVFFLLWLRSLISVDLCVVCGGIAIGLCGVVSDLFMVSRFHVRSYCFRSPVWCRCY